MSNHETFSAHSKRVTLRLALLSAAVGKRLGLRQALEALEAVGWDTYKLGQNDLELLFVEFDDALEQEIRGEFEADPEYLVDLAKSPMGASCSCKLCGHEPIRWEFLLRNTAGGKDVNTGSECIVTWGLNVKGVATSEQARKALEAAIRRRLREYELAEWHEKTGFHAQLLTQVAGTLKAIRNNPATEYTARMKARYLTRDLRVLERFYTRTGWLGTEKKASEWDRVLWWTLKLSGQQGASWAVWLVQKVKQEQPVVQVKQEPVVQKQPDLFAPMAEQEDPGLFAPMVDAFWNGLALGQVGGVTQ